ncbi:MAG: IspD/TarI family cytidylyltransferase [Actinomycetota bacterium]|nr:IspD/TarI family cytidylyltransferase [Actinomycetota bacterium]MDA3008570.1 IspD/TarI family cytidylyltransferase [Actinomycetota bacterium]MDA3037594.1 IspD/TarI family cytidylyltransferase [Actinomycetota bacterium]
MKTYGVILAAGDSTRFGAEVNKLFHKVNGKELVLYPVKTFIENKKIDEVLIVSSGSNKSALEKLLAEYQSVSIILGGNSRQESEYCALQHLQNKATENCLIVIHDAARSFMSSQLLTNLVSTAKEHGSAAPYLDNSKFYDIENNEIVTKRKIVDIQTPQVYRFKELFDCYSFLSKNNITGMVDTTESMFKFNKFKTHVIKGEESNLKITYKSDLDIVEKAVI